MNTFTLSALLGASVASAQLAFGWCPLEMPTPVGNFEPEKYAGTWYEIMRDKDLWYEKNSECVTATYRYDKNIPFWPVGVNNRAWNTEKNEYTNTKIDGTDWEYARASFDPNGNGRV
jgi:lipocalin